MDEIRAGAPVFRPWNLKLRTPDLLWNPLQSWVEEDNVDLEYHVRRSALPSPGDERELGIVVSRLHGHPIDFHRPPWEVAPDRGPRGRPVRALRQGPPLAGRRVLRDEDPVERAVDAIPTIASGRCSSRSRSRREPRPATKPDDHEGVLFPELLAAVREQYGATKSVARALRNVVHSTRRATTIWSRRCHAPKCILNARISRSRRFATQKLETARLRAIAKAVGRHAQRRDPRAVAPAACAATSLELQRAARRRR